MMPRILSAFALASALVLGSLPAVAGDAGATNVSLPPTKPASVDSKDPRKVPVLAKLLEDGLKPRYIKYDKKLGWDVWFVEQKDHSARNFYTHPSGCCLFGGNVWSEDGAGSMVYDTGQHFIEATAILASEGVFPAANAAASATPLQKAEPASAPNPPIEITGSRLLAEFDKAKSIEMATNKNAPLIYVVVDPECEFCHRFWRDLRPHISAGKVRARLIIGAPLAGINQGKSLISAINILAARDPAAAWDAHVDSRPFDQGDDEAVATARAKFAVNEQMRIGVLEANKLNGVPFILFRNADGAIGYNRGMKSDDVPRMVKSLSTLHK